MWRRVLGGAVGGCATLGGKRTRRSCCIHLSTRSSTENNGSSGGGAPSPSPSPSPSPPPPPIRVLVTESAGRGVFASRKIEAGQLIHTAKPILSHPYLSPPPPPPNPNTTVTCYLCLKNLNSNNNDSPMPLITFCSPQCEHHSLKGFYEVEKLADWSSHTQHCCTQGLRYPFLAKRLACMVVSGVATADALDILQPAILSSEMISQMEKEFTLLRKALEEANIPNEKTSFLTMQWYIGVLARIRINAFRIEIVGTSYEDLLSLAAASVEAEAAVGNALYMLPSFYNHDCDPNAHIVWIESVDARVKALRDIDEGIYNSRGLMSSLINKVKNCGSAISTQVWNTVLAKESSVKVLDLNVAALGVGWVIKGVHLNR